MARQHNGYWCVLEGEVASSAWPWKLLTVAPPEWTVTIQWIIVSRTAGQFYCSLVHMHFLLESVGGSFSASHKFAELTGQFDFHVSPASWKVTRFAFKWDFSASAISSRIFWTRWLPSLNLADGWLLSANTEWLNILIVAVSAVFRHGTVRESTGGQYETSKMICSKNSLLSNGLAGRTPQPLTRDCKH